MGVIHLYTKMLPTLLKGIIKDLKDGLTINQIVRARRCTAKEVIEVADKNLGIKLKNPIEGRKQGGGPIKITDKQIVSMKKDKSSGMTYIEISKKYGCSRSHANMIITGRRRKAVSNA